MRHFILVAVLLFVFAMVASAQTTKKPSPQSQKPCIKHPPNFQQVNLPCGGYDKPSCDRVCKQLGHTGSYCKQEDFCLCHSGNLYSC